MTVTSTKQLEALKEITVVQVKYWYEETKYGLVLRVRKNVFTSAVWSREHKGVNTIIIIYGKRGIGKSYLAMKIAEVLSMKMHNRQFTAEDIVFDFIGFMKRLKHYEKKGVKWAWMMFDEAGLEVGARDFMKDINKALSKVLQSFRRTAINLVVCVPHPDMIDKILRNMAEYWFTMKGRGKARVYKVEWSPFRSKVQSPLFALVNGASLPSPELYEPYEEKREKYLNVIYDRYLVEAEHRVAKKVRSLMAPEMEKAILDKYKKQYLEGNIGKKELGYALADEFGISLSTAYQKRRKILLDIRDERQQAQTQTTGNRGEER